MGTRGKENLPHGTSTQLLTTCIDTDATLGSFKGITPLPRVMSHLCQGTDNLWKCCDHSLNVNVVKSNYRGAKDRGHQRGSNGQTVRLGIMHAWVLDPSQFLEFSKARFLHLYEDGYALNWWILTFHFYKPIFITPNTHTSRKILFMQINCMLFFFKPFGFPVKSAGLYLSWYHSRKI